MSVELISKGRRLFCKKIRDYIQACLAATTQKVTREVTGFGDLYAHQSQPIELIGCINYDSHFPFGLSFPILCCEFFYAIAGLLAECSESNLALCNSQTSNDWMA